MSCIFYSNVIMYTNARILWTDIACVFPMYQLILICLHFVFEICHHVLLWIWNVQLQLFLINLKSCVPYIYFRNDLPHTKSHDQYILSLHAYLGMEAFLSWCFRPQQFVFINTLTLPLSFCPQHYGENDAAIRTPHSLGSCWKDGGIIPSSIV